MYFGNCAAAWALLASFPHQKASSGLPKKTKGDPYKGAYRSAIFKIHPDHCKEPGCQAMSELAIKAYNYLHDPDKKCTAGTLSSKPDIYGAAATSSTTENSDISTQEAVNILRFFAKPNDMFTGEMLVGTKENPFKNNVIDFSYWNSIQDNLVKPALAHTDVTNCSYNDRYCESGVQREMVNICVQKLLDIAPATQVSMAAPTVLKLFPDADINSANPEHVVGTKAGIIELQGVLAELGINI